MRVALVLAGLLLVLAVFGVAGFFGYQLYVKPKQIAKTEAKEAEVAPTPPPDYSVPAFEKAMEPYNRGDLAAAREALRSFIAQFPQSPKAGEAKRALGDINTSVVFSSADSPEKVVYTVVSGDALVKIAKKTRSNAELIFRANNLESINLQIGQQLRIPQLEPSIVIDRKASTLTLLNKGEFFKEYPILSVKAPALRGDSPVNAKITDKVALKDQKRVAFGDKDYIGSERWLKLDAAGIVIRGAPDGVTDPAAMPPGIVVSQEEIEEIFPLVSGGTPVTVR